MTKIAYNSCYGGFSLSPEAVRLGRELSGTRYWAGFVLKGENWDDGHPCQFDATGIGDHPRTDPLLIEVIERLGEAASGPHSRLLIREVPAGTRYRIEEYDGFETVRLESEYTWQTA